LVVTSRSAPQLSFSRLRQLQSLDLTPTIARFFVVGVQM
jgi:hypothetical protein